MAADPRQVLHVLPPGGVYATQQVGGRIRQAIFDAFGWGSNGEFWGRHYAELGLPFWHMASMAKYYAGAGCEVLRREEADMEDEFLYTESLAYWLLNEPLPETVDPDRHADVLDKLPLKTNWHSELLVVRRGPAA